jgi:disulfide bond formation protein DsbB
MEFFKTDYLSRYVFIIAGCATVGSLYISVALGITPCKYCWYQRILMYPMVVISFYSIYRSINLNGLYFVFSSIGILLSLYHSIIQRTATSGLCSAGCSTIVYKVGPLTVPNLSLIAFTMIFFTTLGYHVYR